MRNDCNCYHCHYSRKHPQLNAPTCMQNIPQTGPIALKRVVNFIRSHGLQALAINGDVHSEDADGVRRQVRTMAEAREAPGY